MSCRVYGSEILKPESRTDRFFVPSLDSNPNNSSYVFVCLDNGTIRARDLYSIIFDICKNCPANPYIDGREFGYYPNPTDINHSILFLRCQPLERRVRKCINVCPIMHG